MKKTSFSYGVPIKIPKKTQQKSSQTSTRPKPKAHARPQVVEGLKRDHLPAASAAGGTATKN